MKAALPLIFLALSTPGLARDLKDICNREDRGQIYDCLRAEHQARDREMSGVYNALIPALQSFEPEAVPKLRQAQRAWIAFRDADCRLAQYRDLGGREELIYQAECLILRTKSRRDELRHWLQALPAR